MGLVAVRTTYDEDYWVNPQEIILVALKHSENAGPYLVLKMRDGVEFSVMNCGQNDDWIPDLIKALSGEK